MKSNALSAGMALLATISQSYAKCELDDYSFKPKFETSWLDINESTVIEFAFYPIPNQRMNFHTALHEQVTLSSWQEIQNRSPMLITNRYSPIVSAEYGSGIPFVVQVPVRKIGIDRGVRYEFGSLGSIQASVNESVSIGVCLYDSPSEVCAPYSSYEGFCSEQVTFLALE